MGATVGAENDPLLKASTWVVPRISPPGTRLAWMVTVTRLCPFPRPAPVNSVRRFSLENVMRSSWIPSPFLSVSTVLLVISAGIWFPAYFRTNEESITSVLA